MSYQVESCRRFHRFLLMEKKEKAVGVGGWGGEREREKLEGKKVRKKEGENEIGECRGGLKEMFRLISRNDSVEPFIVPPVAFGRNLLKTFFLTSFPYEIMFSFFFFQFIKL